MEWSLLFLSTIIVLLLAFLPFTMYQLLYEESGAQTYLRYWTFNHSVVIILKSFFLQSNVILGLQIVLLSYLIILSLGWFINKYGDRTYISYATLGIILLFPVQHPWYYMLLFFNILFIPSHRLFCILLSSTIGMSYLAYSNSHLLLISISHWFLSIILYQVYKAFTNTPRYLSFLRNSRSMPLTFT